MTLSKTFEAKLVESKWYQFWQEKGLFKADPTSSKPPFCIVIPPPNVTGALHMGHALVNTLQDVIIRWKRMCGFEALWVPGTDHAGIATQTVVERHLIKTEGKNRKSYTREAFLEKVWLWKDENADRIIQQLKRLGCSCDWSRLRFTMDEGNNRAVKVVFKKLFDQGLIYKGDYLVNWDPVTQTALADDEVEYEEKQGFLWVFKYPLEEGGYLSIATTRPETMLGDTAVAVSPKDPRYQHLIGKTLILPITERKIPIIADPFVDPEFGTGAVKVTPAHDPNDYEMGLRHSLSFINILTPDGKINEEGGSFCGLSIQEARGQVVEKMKELGLLEKVEPHIHRVGHSYRSKAVVEPYLSKQWFVKMTAFKQMLRQLVETNAVRLVPKSWEATYFHWIDHLRDWCISRQLWWGHQIPIWYHKENPEKIICYDGEGVPDEVAKNPAAWEQDEDVLDTWFSSALWPFAALGWPEKTILVEKFYPNATLITGHDILFFWVARMLMMGEAVMEKPPFPEVFLHGLIFGKSYWRQEKEGGISYVSEEDRCAFDLGKQLPKDVHFKWEKMSKSKGNVIDPLEIIGSYGTDAMRMALCASPTGAREIDLDRRKFEEFKNFANKVWNGARFVLMNLEGISFEEGIDFSMLSLEDRWIFSLLEKTVQEVNQHLSLYQFDQAALKAYDFFWRDFCSYYVEIAKKALGTDRRANTQKVLSIILCQAIRLIHPMAPFITEELFQKLKEQIVPKMALDPFTDEMAKALSCSSCMVAPYPVPMKHPAIDPQVRSDFEALQEIVYTIRNIRGEMGLAPGVATDLYFVGGKELLSPVKENLSIIASLVRADKSVFSEDEPAHPFLATGLVKGLKIFIPLPKELIEQEKNRLLKRKDQLEGAVKGLEKTLSASEFLSKAPLNIVEKQKQTLLQAQTDLQEVLGKLKQF